MTKKPDREKRRRDLSDSPFRSPFGSDFDMFDEMFGEHFGGLDEMLKRMMESDRGSSRLYGYSMYMGPDGVPHVREFGNLDELRALPAWGTGSCTSCGTDETGGGAVCGPSSPMEPFIDIIEKDETVTVTIELPCVEKEEISLEAKDSSLEISVDNEEKRFHKVIELPCDVKTGGIKATYKNGVLDITMKRKAKRKKGKKVEIE